MMSTTDSAVSEISTKCTVLVIGGGPGGSYAASALAREGLDVVVLEADVFPRYHIGESMLASMRHLLRFVDLDTTFNEYGFTKKVGAAFKLNPRKREGYTDFLAAGGPENYAWNVVRSEADELMFRHAGKCGAKIFDGVKVTALEFAPKNPAAAAVDESSPNSESDLGRPVRATWSRKGDNATGSIDFEYVIDASGRVGLLCTKYLKNRNYNQGLKNVAHWGYWSGADKYAPDTPRAGSPFFEALQDESGWAWLIPLHNGTTSVGIVMNQELATKKRQALGSDISLQDFYLDQLHLAPGLRALLANGALISTPSGGGSAVKSASDYSYSSKSYAVPGARVVGDAGAFIDPYFSSGVHLALTGALSAALTICAAKRGELSEEEAARWHSEKTATAYTRFLMVVLSAYRQIRAQEQPVLSDFDEDNFDRAFAFFRPVIQGAADIDKNLSQAELAKTLDFCAHAFEPTEPAEREAVLAKVEGTNGHASATTTNNAASNGSANANVKETSDPKVVAAAAAFSAKLSAEESRVLQHVQARRMMRTEDTLGMGSFTADALHGRVPRLERGRLGLDVVGGTDASPVAVLA